MVYKRGEGEEIVYGRWLIVDRLLQIVYGHRKSLCFSSIASAGVFLNAVGFTFSLIATISSTVTIFAPWPNIDLALEDNTS